MEPTEVVAVNSAEVLMLRLLKSLFGYDRDEARRHESPAADAARMLEMDEPMAAAGAQLSGERDNSETEEALRRATGEDVKRR